MKSRSKKMINSSPRWKRSVISSAVAVSLATMHAPTVLATNYSVAGAETEPYTLTLADRLTLSSDDTLIVGGASAVVAVDASADGVEINNSGLISQTAGSNAIYVDAAALDITIDNKSGGRIFATSTAAIYFFGNMDGTLDNAGAISAVANVTSGGSSATATGIYVGGSLLGTLANDGTITAAADVLKSISTVVSDAGDAIAAAAATVYAYAVGIGASVLDIGASITNSGTIQATSVANAIASSTASSTGGSATARVFDPDPAKAYATATGIYAGEMGVDSSMVNEGTITASAVATALAAASGVSDAASSVAAASANASAYATGIEAGNLSEGASIINEWTITASAVATATALASASGVAATDATATATASAYATGIEAGDLGANSSIVNDGTIIVSAVAMTSTLATASGVPAAISTDELAYAYAVGISSGNLDAGAFIRNNHIIAATATSAGTGDATARGISAGDLSGIDATVTNDDEIDATATAADGEAYAAGIYAASVGAGARIENSSDGIITVTANGSTTSTDTASATARGIDVGSVTGADSEVSNNNIIDATATTSAAGDVNATGIHAGSVGSGASIVNGGTITATVDSKATSTVDSTATAHGLNLGTLSGMVMNESDILAIATASGVGEVYAVGIHANTLSAAGEIDSGILAAEATSTAAGIAYARGIEVGTLSGSIFSNDSVTANATGSAAGDVYAAGIYATNLSGGASIGGGGTIMADATSTGTGKAYARGIEAVNLSGTVTNGLAIDATATGSAAGDVYAAGIYAGSLSSGSNLEGSGTIAASATTTDAGDAYARGIETVTWAGTFTNDLAIEATATAAAATGDVFATGVYAGSVGANAGLDGGGTIIAIATTDSTGNATARGIDVVDMAGGSFTNNIAISAKAETTDGGGGRVISAYGIFTEDMAGADTVLTNASDILAEASSASGGDSVLVYGMKAGTLEDGAVVSNEGTIEAEAGGGAGVASAYGIHVDTLNSTVLNSGTISVSADDKPYSIYVAAGTGEVNNSGRMSGIVKLLGDVNMTNSGLVSIANNANIENSTIEGNYTQSSTGVLRVGVVDDGTYTQLAVSDDVTFEEGAAANLSVEVHPDAALADEMKMEDVVSAGLLLNVPNGFNITDNSLAWQFSAAEDNSENIDLTASSTGMTTLAAVAGSSSTAGVAGAIDDILAGDGEGGVVEALYTLTSLGTAAEVAAALHSFAPVLGGSFAQSTADVLSTGATRVVQEHLQDASGIASGDGTLVEDSGWIKPFGTWAKQKDRSGANGYQADSYGLVLGRDKKISDQWGVGGAFSYSKGKVESSNASQNVDMRTLQASIYATNHFNETNALNLQFDLGTNRNDSRREVAGSVATANYGSRHIMMNAELERAFRRSGKVTLTPAVGVQYVNVRVGGYSESGSPLNLTVGSQSQKAVILSLGGTAVYKLDDEASLTAHLNLGRDIKAGQGQVTASFSNYGGSTFVTNGTSPSANVIRAGVGYEIEKASGTSIVTRYDLDTKSSGYTNHMLSVNLKALF